MPGAADEITRRARLALLDALDALGAQRAAVILDADLVVEPSGSSARPRGRGRLATRFLSSAGQRVDMTQRRPHDCIARDT